MEKEDGSLLSFLSRKSCKKDQDFYGTHPCLLEMLEGTFSSADHQLVSV